MKSSIIQPLALIAMSLLFANCTKKDATPTLPEPTALQITAIDNAGIKVSGATISLYNSQASFLAESGAIATQTTDANGKATFSNLASQKYWFLIKKDCANNVHSSTSTASAITANATSSVTAQLAATGTLRLVNSSSNPYRVYVNGVV